MFTMVAHAVAKNRNILLGVVVSILAGFLVSPAVLAVDTGVSVDIVGSTAPDLQLDGSTSVVSSMPVILTGQVSNLTQIRVYVDGVFTATVPLTPADTTFSYSLWVGEGLHTVKFVGVSAYTSTNVEKIVTVEFRNAPSTAPTGQGSINNSSSPRTNGIIVGESTQPPSTGSSGNANGGIKAPQWVVRILVPLTVINPDRVGDTPRMAARFVLIASGLTFLVFTYLVLAAYRSIASYRIFAKKPRLPTFLRDNPSFWLRLFGVVALLAAFLWV